MISIKEIKKRLHFAYLVLINKEVNSYTENLFINNTSEMPFRWFTYKPSRLNRLKSFINKIRGKKDKRFVDDIIVH